MQNGAKRWGSCRSILYPKPCAAIILAKLPSNSPSTFPFIFPFYFPFIFPLTFPFYFPFYSPSIWGGVYAMR